MTTAAPQDMLPHHDNYRDDILKGLLDQTRTVALVGASANWNRPSYFVMKYLQLKGFKVFPINPREVGKEILGEPVFADLYDLADHLAPAPIDLVDIFRNSDAAAAIVDDAIAVGARAVWMQIGVRHDAAAAKAEAAGLHVIMNRCPKIEYSRLYGELSWGGFNSGVISSKRRKLS